MDRKAKLLNNRLCELKLKRTKQLNHGTWEHTSERRVFMAVTCNYGMKSSMRLNNTLISMHYFVLALWAISCLLSYVSHHNGINVLQTKNSHALLARSPDMLYKYSSSHLITFHSPISRPWFFMTTLRHGACSTTPKLRIHETGYDKWYCLPSICDAERWRTKSTMSNDDNYG